MNHRGSEEIARPQHNDREAQTEHDGIDQTVRHACQQISPKTALQLKTNMGSIKVSGVSGQMALSRNTGSVEVSGGTVRGDTELITNTGSVTFNGAIEQSGIYTFTTDTGSVNVTLPAESVFHVDASTDTGSINTNFPGVVVQHRQMVGSDAHGDVGSSPQATITLRTSTGSINLYQG